MKTRSNQDDQRLCLQQMINLHHTPSASHQQNDELNSRLAPQASAGVPVRRHDETSEISKINCANIVNNQMKFLSPMSHQTIKQHHCRPMLRYTSQEYLKFKFPQDQVEPSVEINLQSTTRRTLRRQINSSIKRSHKATNMRKHHYHNHLSIFSFAIFCFVLLSTFICCASNSLQQHQLPQTVMAITSTTASSTNDRRTTEIDAAKATSVNNYNNNNSDTQLQRMSEANEQSQQPAIERVAKAEALTAPIVDLNSNAHPSVPQAAALQQQSPARLFEVCKVQIRTGQQLTNLSQIVFQPSDTCSTWSKMMRASNSDLSSPSSSSESYPWYYIEQLILSHNNLSVLHDSSGMSRLSNLLDLRITHNQLARCEESSLNGLQRLQILDLSHNKLMALPAKFFQPVKHTIKKLNLSFNSISVLVPSLFDSLNQLEYLDLSHNDITSHWVNDRLFKNLTQLHYLDLSFNKLTVFSSAATFSSLSSLETLSLQHNELRQVPETVQHLRHLSSLDLSQNFIHDITNASYLSNCRLLFNLNLESNLLENITRDAFSDLPALKVLNLANNRIHHLDQQAFDCKYISLL